MNKHTEVQTHRSTVRSHENTELCREGYTIVNNSGTSNQALIIVTSAGIKFCKVQKVDKRCMEAWAVRTVTVSCSPTGNSDASEFRPSSRAVVENIPTIAKTSNKFPQQDWEALLTASAIQ